MDELDLARLRQEYAAAGLREDDLPADPLELWRRWLADAQAAALAEVNAMVVASVGADGRPSARLVLCKGADDDGFVFFTNYHSRKATELDADPHAALLFPWHPLGRQVRVEGVAAHLDSSESDAYFASRPRGAQLSAWASAQSSVVAARDELERQMSAYAEQFADADVPRPPHWGGVRVEHRVVEFWQGRPDRLHDRLVYRREALGAPWTVVRLGP
jgi:pyridoxamine 5'-phosphate oxidase